MKLDLIAHLRSRHLDLELHRPWLCHEQGVATFPLWNLSGQLVGYQQYNPLGDKKVSNSKAEGKYYTYRNKNTPTVLVWGVESLVAYGHRPSPVFVTEGVFDAARLTERGCVAFATLCNDPPADYANWLGMLNRKVVVVADGDSAGRKLGKLARLVRAGGADAEVHEMAPGTDMGDASDAEVVEFLSRYA